MSVKSCRTLASGKTLHATWQALEGMKNSPVNPDVNEFYMFHGTNPAAAQAITEGDFRVDLAGSNAGTLYGRGIYYSEEAALSGAGF